MKRLFIAEKPSLGRAIADGLGAGQSREGHILCGDDVVTWCFGHLLEQSDPQDYDPALKTWSRETLPFIPTEWKLKPKKDAEKQLAIIGNLLQEAECVVHAGDPDREGQLLVDQVLERFDYRGQVLRIWLASLDDRSVQKALASLKNNAEYASLRDAARARSRADWLVGINATRAMTLAGRESGRDGVLSLGRVQTPTLALVVQRDREIEAFKPVDYFTLQAALEHPAGAFHASFVPGDLQAGLDSDGRLTDKAVADALAQAAKGQAGQIRDVTAEKKKKAVPLPHCLSSLQKAASARFGLTAQEVLDLAQSLYEKKLTTYPRSDCRYLPEEQRTDAANILAALAKIPELEQAVAHADAALRGPVWDTKKVTAHHAIVPTGVVPSGLSDNERSVYTMIALAYCLQFYGPLIYEAQKIAVELGGTAWEARGRVVLEPGWTQATAEEDDDSKEKAQSLPAVTAGDAVTCSGVDVLKKKTSPPPRFTEGSLIEAMASVHRFVTDAKAKATLKENEGIGTEATRAGILERLKDRGFLAADKKALVSTPLGREIIDLTPDTLKNPVTTAHWETRLEEIASGKESLAAFMADQVGALPDLMAPILSAKPKLAKGAFPCPSCGRALARKKNEKGPYWACFNEEGHPDGKPVFMSDDNGKPVQRQAAVPSEHPCPVCGQPLFAKKNAQGPYWGCFNKEGHPDGKPVFMSDDNGKPVQREGPKVSDFTCRECGKSLAIKPTKRGGVWFSCTGYPDCKGKYWSKPDGTPDYDNPPK